MSIDVDVSFVGWQDAPGTHDRALFEVRLAGDEPFLLSLHMPESVGGELRASSRRDDESDHEFVTRVREAVRRFGPEAARSIVADDDRLRAARHAGRYEHEIAGQELQRLRDLLGSSPADSGGGR
ncbi:MAG TPA: hypothetical protein VHF25_07175 [Nitriliruptorales bacterium]|nr:hypothetical protein [Nitriliruptorales bacterium]